MCGEKIRVASPRITQRGSPPRVRGKGGASWSSWPPAGITPACAGKSRLLNKNQPRFWDHPRVCGEKHGSLVCRVAHSGSPPRVRGKACGAGVLDVVGGITPACAGKSRTGSGPVPGPKDHPRVCGEKLPCMLFLVCASGSPPRVRGKACGAGVLDVVGGITPACAGKRSLPESCQPVFLDHPRVCGEKTKKIP